MKYFLLPLFVLLSFGIVQAQQPEQPDNKSIEDYKKDCKLMVKYLEGTLNFIGDPASTVQEKEIVINQSFDKIFRDSEVQIEDDLDDQRETPISKDVQAYLKDVDFFFRKAVFTFDISKVDQLVAADGSVYFKVSLMRKLDAIAINGDIIENSRERFVEINLDPFKKDLKIVSYYTTKLNEREELRYWWNSMSFAWKDFFASGNMVYDTLPMTDILGLTNDAFVHLQLYGIIRQDSFMVVDTDTLPMSFRPKLFGHRPDTVLFLNDTVMQWLPDTVKADLSPVYSLLRQFAETKEINISYKQQFQDLEPLAKLTELQLIDCSNTPISDLSPLRNLNKLDAIYFSGTAVSDLTPLQYSTNIKEIFCFNTPITDLNVLGGFRALQKLYCFNTGISSLSPISGMQTLEALRASNTAISDLEALRNLSNLSLLDISNTAVIDLSPLAELSALQLLNFDHTGVSEISVLANMPELSLVQMSHTKVSTLRPLAKLQNLSKIYCDNTGVTTEQATEFMRSRPKVLVIYETEALKAWWNNLPIYWKAILSKQANISAEPTTEQLHEVIGLQSLDLSGNSYLQNLVPVGRLTSLESLLMSNTEITDLAPLFGLNLLKVLDVSNTRVSELEPLRSLLSLEQLNIENTRVEKLEPLFKRNSLKLLRADGSRVTAAAVAQLKAEQPQLLILYQTQALQSWWGNLSQQWRDIFAQYVPYDVNPNALELQQITDLEEITIENDLSLQSIVPLSKLPYLKKLQIKGSGVQDLSPLKGKLFLTELELPGNPITDITVLADLPALQVLNLESTQVSDLSPVASLGQLRVLNVGGTKVRSLKPLAALNKLEDLSINNTSIKSLSPADELPNLKNLKCFNTRIKSKTINALKSSKPALNVLYY